LDNVLKGIESIRIAESLDPDSEVCKIGKDLIRQAITNIFSSINLDIRDASASVFSIEISTIPPVNSDYCVSNVNAALYYKQHVTLGFANRTVIGQFKLWESAELVESRPVEHARRTSKTIEDLAKAFVTAWNLDNKSLDKNIESPGTPVTRAVPPASEGPGSVPPASDPLADLTKKSPPTSVGSIADADRADAEKTPKDSPPTGAVSGPAASSTLADSDASKPDAKTETEVVTVKYRGPVSLAPFTCDPVTRSSFIQRVCYDAANSSLLLDLGGTWYQFCGIDAGTVSDLMAAESINQFYNASVRGHFNCRNTT
jgi:hypothetical protein